MSRVLVLLHAFPLDHRMWSVQQEHLGAAGWEVLALDLPGFGGSALLDGEPSLGSVAEVITQHLELEGIEGYALAGLSLGGYVAMAMVRQAMAAGRGDAIASLILCDTKASADSPQAVVNRIRLAEAVSVDPGNSGRILSQAILPGLLGQTTHTSRPEVVDLVGQWLDEADPQAVSWYQQAMADRPDSHDLLRMWSAPTLVLWGSEDSLSPQAEQESMLSVLSAGRSAVIDGVGHLSAVEDPDAVTERMRQFLDQVS
jgi:pimeloyl-ACP methyl ester carboxylesterase